MITFFVVAFAFTWALLPLARTSTPVGLVALFGPTVAAIVTAAWAGRPHVQELRSRVAAWRVPIRWYLLAMLLPLPISAMASLLELLWGAPGPIGLLPISPLSLLVFVLVIGEEIGWRGFALPRLLPRFGRWGASVLLGSVWAFWHLPLFFMASMPQFGQPFPAFVLYTIALSVILTWLAENTRGSILIATLSHGVVNTFVIVNAGATPLLRGWGNAASYGVAALIVGAAAWGARAVPSLVPEAGSSSTGVVRPGRGA